MNATLKKMQRLVAQYHLPKRLRKNQIVVTDEKAMAAIMSAPLVRRIYGKVSKV